MATRTKIPGATEPAQQIDSVTGAVLTPQTGVDADALAAAAFDEGADADADRPPVVTRATQKNPVLTDEGWIVPEPVGAA